MNEGTVTDTSIEDWDGDLDANSKKATFDGKLNVAASFIDTSGNKHDVEFYVEVLADAIVEIETEEIPTGWNYGTDRIIYSRSTYMTAGDVHISHIKYADDEIVVDGQPMSFFDAQKYIGANVVHQLLNPSLYIDYVSSLINDKVDSINIG